MKTRSKTIENKRYFLSPWSIHNRFETKMIIHLSPLYFTRDFLPDYHVRIKTVIWNYMDKPLELNKPDYMLMVRSAQTWR